MIQLTLVVKVSLAKGGNLTNMSREWGLWAGKVGLSQAVMGRERGAANG